MIQVLGLKDEKGAWTSLTLELLSDARDFAAKNNLGVSLWSLSNDDNINEQLTEQCRQLGITHIKHLFHPDLIHCRCEIYSEVLLKNLDPKTKMLFLPQTSFGEEVAALLSAAGNMRWIPNVLSATASRTGQLLITCIVPGLKFSKTLRFPPEHRPVILTMKESVAEIKTSPQAPTRDQMTVEYLPIQISSRPWSTSVKKLVPADPATIDICFAKRIVSIGRGVNESQSMDLVVEFAKTLKASLAASRVVVDQGLMPASRQVGQTGKSVRPNLYLALGISGADHHLMGMKESQHIVAINNDPSAPIHKVAHFSLKEDLRVVLPLIQQKLSARKKSGHPTEH